MMYPLLLSGLIALTVVIERLWLLKRKLATPKAVVEDVLSTISKKGDSGLALPQDNFSPVLNVLARGMEQLSAPIEEIELSMENEAERWIPVIEKRLEVLDTIITAAPLMGLLGTITGMMASFRVLSEKGVNEPGAITGGVAEALIATATGLVIALISLVFFNYLNQLVKDLISEMETTGARFIEARRAYLRSSK